MRTIAIILAAVLVNILSTSCASYNYMTTDISRDLSAQRTLYAEADSAYLADGAGDSPFFFRTDQGWETGKAIEPFSKNFYGDTRVMNIYAMKHMENIADGKLLAGKAGLEGCPLLSPQETVRKHFRWFCTVYEYTAVYSRIDSLPVPVGDFISEDELQLFFRGCQMPADWNGIELYSKLDEISTEFVRWYTSCSFKVSSGIITGFCDTALENQLETHSEEVLARLTENEEEITPEGLCKMLDKTTGGNSFMQLYGQHKADIDAQYEEQTRILEYFNYAMISEISLPGKLTGTSATAFNDGHPQWKIDCYRLLCGDLEISATSRETNLWAYLVTFILLAGCIYLAVRKR